MPAPKPTIEQNEFLGLYTLRRANEIPPLFAAHTLNSDHSSSSQITPMKGYTRFGNQANASDKIVNQFSYERGLGLETLLQVRDDGSNTILEYLNPSDNRNSANGEWIPLITNFTKDLIWSFAAFNDTGTDNLLMSNGTDNFSRWSGAVCKLGTATSGGEATLTVAKITGDPKTNATDGFPSSGTLTVKDDAGTTVSITYTGKTATTFTGCSGVTAMSVNAGIAEAVDVTTHSAVPKFRFIITAQGRVWGTNKIAAGTLLQYSKVGDFTDWTAGTAPDDPGSADFPEGGNNLVLGSIDDWIIIGKTKEMWAYSFQYPTSSTRVPIRKKISDVGVAAQKAFALVGSDYWYVSPEGQVRSVSRLEAENVFITEDLAHNISPTIKGFDYSDCSCIYWPKERIFLASAKSDSDQSANDKVITLQFSENSKGSANVSHGIMDWFIGDMAVYQEDLYFGGSSESRCHKAFNSFAKDGAPYIWEYTTRIENFGSEFVKKEVTMLAVKGLIGAGTTLNIEVLYNEAGSLTSVPLTISDTDTDYITAGISNPLGSTALGSEPLGGTVEDVDDLDHFLVYYPITNKAYPYNAQINFKTDGAGQRVVVTSYALYARDARAELSPKKGS